MSTLLLEALSYMQSHVAHGSTPRHAARRAARLFHLNARTLVRYWHNAP